MRKADGYKRFFNGQNRAQINAFLRSVFGWIRGPQQRKRFDDRPKWLKEELIQKALEKREMRARKRLLECKKGTMTMLVATKRKRVKK